MFWTSALPHRGIRSCGVEALSNLALHLEQAHTHMHMHMMYAAAMGWCLGGVGGGGGAAYVVPYPTHGCRASFEREGGGREGVWDQNVCAKGA